MVVKATTSPYPNLHRHESEKFFSDPKKKNSKLPFPSISDPPSIDLSVIVPAYNEEERCEFLPFVNVFCFVLGVVVFVRFYCFFFIFM